MSRQGIARTGACVVSFFFSSTAFAQLEATIEPLPGIAYDVTEDGTVVVGEYENSESEWRGYRWVRGVGAQDLGTIENKSGSSAAYGVAEGGAFVVGSSAAPNTGGRRASRWTPADGMAALGTDTETAVEALDVSDDGSVVVGYAFPGSGGRMAFRWTPTDGYQELGTIEGLPGHSLAQRVSDDGAVVVGTSWIGSATNRAFRWTEADGMQDIGSLASGPTVAYGVSPDGSFVVGDSRLSSGWYAPYIWSADTGIQPLTPIWGSQGLAYDVSSDGNIVVGFSSSETGGTACVWTDGEPRALPEILETDYGLDLSDWSAITDVQRCSADGSVLAGIGYYKGERTGYVVTIASPPEIVGDLVDGGEYEIPVGVPFSAAFTASSTMGSPITLTADGVPDDASLIPESGSQGPSPMSIEFDWTPTVVDVGSTRQITLTVDDRDERRATLTFELTVLANEPPVVEPLVPWLIECEGDESVVSFETLVEDAEDDPMTATWSVDGRVEQTETNVRSGTYVGFEYAFPHGESEVSLTVSDAYGETTVGTTVTVADTTAPTVIVAADVVVPTDPGKDHAANVRVEAPEVYDLCDGDPEVTNNAPKIFPLGTTTVRWTAKDADGNVATARQKVTVEDREAPTIGSVADVNVNIDGDATHATVKLARPSATDNVPAGLTLASNAPKTYPIGKTTVAWTAEDAAGNQTTKKLTVRVTRRGEEYRPSGAIANYYCGAAQEYAYASLAYGNWSADAIDAYYRSVYASEYGRAAGDRISWSEFVTREQAHSKYVELRYGQCYFSWYASDSSYRSYAATGDLYAYFAWYLSTYAYLYAASDVGS